MCRRKSNQTISDQRTTTNRCKRIISKHCDDSGIRKHYQLFFHLVLFGIICNILELQIVAMPINLMESCYCKYRISYAFLNFIAKPIYLSQKYDDCDQHVEYTLLSTFKVQ